MNSYKKYDYICTENNFTLRFMRGIQNFLATKPFISMKKYIALCLMLCSIQFVTAQFQVQYNHINPLKFSLEDFNKVVIISNADQPSVRVRYALLDDKKKKICEVNFKLLPMIKGINKLNYASGELVWHNSPYRDLLIKNQLVSGNFQLCVSVTDIYETMPEADDCFDVELQSIGIQNDLNANPIELQSPSHKDTIDEIRPLLTWIPPSPTYQGTNYQILLVEKKENQTCTEALNNNIPFIHKKDIITNILNYPTDAQALEKGNKYCWRASAHKDLKEYSRSEDWEFMVRENKTDFKQYLIEDVNKRTIECNTEDLQFVLDNFESIKAVEYTIEFLQNEVWIKKDQSEINLDYEKGVLKISNSDIENKGTYRIQILNLNNKDYTWFITKH